MPPSKRLLKAREVAHLFDVEVSTVVEWARTGKIPALKTPGGREYRFRPSDVETLMSATATSQTA
ncbi:MULTISPECIES: helix-turn-helix domain-containing protein [unclassified Microbispora]|uniref:helix-turn-helix domain-containing protein n=1 Tax=unclassified Microbispora TaxID=2614687 RepID=UPI0021AEA9B0|nr:helix-turn-helix domain-containing protein [Microbispora sp. SCL1-1]